MGVGASTRSIQNNSYKYIVKEIGDIPNDQYTCTDCNLIPELLNIDYDNGMIEFKCPNHGNKKMEFKDYFKKELERGYHYYNNKCDIDNRKQKDNIRKVFEHCIICKKNFCHECSSKHEHKSSLIKNNELNNKCNIHFKKYIKYCNKCNKHFCESCTINEGSKCIVCNNLLEIIEKPEKDIEILKKQREKLYKNIELEEYSIKLLDTLITTNEKHYSNYFINKNITNIVNNNNYIEKKQLISKLRNLEKKVLDYLNVKLEVKLQGNEIVLNLNGKKVGNLELKLLSSIEFPKLKEIRLPNNKITDISPLKDLSSRTLQILDLSFNHIIEINSLRDILETNPNIREINLNNNEIKSVDVLTKNKFPRLMMIKLDNNNLIKKELDEIKRKLKIKECILTYKLNKKKINLFGTIFVRNNKNNVNMEINGIEKELKEYYELDTSEKEKEILNVKVTMNKEAIDLNNMFNECSSLISLDGISEWNTSNIINLSCFFKGCSSLTSLPDISNWDTSNVIDMSYMFKGCSSLKNLGNIWKWNTKNVTDMQYMFYGCSKLKAMSYISKWDFSKVNNINCIFNECTALENLPSMKDWNIPEATIKKYKENQ